jgi:hypothetical protein
MGSIGRAGRFAVAVLLACAVLGGSPASAQQDAADDAAADSAVDAAVATDAAAPAHPTRSRSDSDPPEDELADVSSGPTLAQRELAARRGHPLDRPSYALDPADLDLPVAVTLSVGGGATVVDSSFDSFLHSHDFAASTGVYLGDVTVLGRIFDSWLWLGGRFGGRARTFVRNDGGGGSAGAVDLQLILMARVQLGRVIDLGVHVGGGGAVAGIALHDGASNGVAPRITAGVHIGFRITHGARIVLRGSYDFCRWFGIDRYNDELELGGPSAAVGLEIRS